MQQKGDLERATLLLFFLSPRLTDVPVYCIFCTGSFWWKIEFLENHVINMRILFDPFSNSNLKSIIVNVIEYPSSGFIFIRTYKKACPLILVFLFAKLFFPDVFM